ncbi:MAG: hypothetical protein ACE5JG_02345 [Planctomycetota bacterium]
MTRASLAAALLGALASSLAAQGSAAEPSCVTHCHGREATAFRECVHAGELSCLECHGGDPKAHRDKRKAHDPAAGYVGKPVRTAIPELCGKCHSDPLRMHAYGLPTDQLAHYRTSGHGRALAAGDAAAAVCTDCHGTHRVLRADDPRAPTARANQPATCGRCHSDSALMDSHELPADSVARFRRSAHGVALLEEDARGAPSCADCHGSHGATPPAVHEVVQVCGQCHRNTADHFRRSAHDDAERMRCRVCHEETAPEYHRAGCAACHGAHAIAAPGSWLYRGQEVGRCGHCHREDGRADGVVAAVGAGRRRLQEAMAATRREIREAKARGVFLDYEQVYLRESERALVSLQPLTHSLDAAAIAGHLEEGLARQARARESIAKKAKVLRDRRLLLSGLAVVLLLLAALVALKLQAVRRLS